MLVATSVVVTAILTPIATALYARRVATPIPLAPEIELNRGGSDLEADEVARG